MAAYTVYLFTLLTILAFAIAVQINKYLKSIVFSAFLISVIILITILVIFDIPYYSYKQGNILIEQLLEPAIVALALPLYQQLARIKYHWKSTLFICFTASLFSMFSGALLALILGASKEMVATILPKSVTTPIAISIAENIGGVPAIASIGVIIAGLFGSIFGYAMLKKYI